MGIERSAPIYVAGHTGLVGSAVVRHLASQGFTRIVTATRAELDLMDAGAVEQFLSRQRPAYVVVASARVGGILANSRYPAEFIHENLRMQTNLIDAAWRHDVRKLLFLGSSCVYPRDCAQPIVEPALLSGPLEQTNAAYAVAKIAGIAMCQAYRRQYGFDAICAMPTNLYGPNDRYHAEDAHVLPALVRRFDEAVRASAPRVELWGSGRALREFLHVDDLARALLLLLDEWSSDEIVNVGSGEEVTIAQLAALIASTCGYRGELVYDATRPDGTPRKALDSSKLRALGWRPEITLEQGVRAVLGAYRAETRAMADAVHPGAAVASQ